MLNQEDDEIDLIFQAMGKRIQKNLSDEETQDLMQELSDTVTKHAILARKKKLEGQTILQPQPQPQQQQQPNAVPMMGMEGSNHVQSHSTSDMNQNMMPPMPQLHRQPLHTMDGYSYNENDITYVNL